MPNASTPFTKFLPAIRAIINAEDHENPTSFHIIEKIKVVVNCGKVPGYMISAEDETVAPSLRRKPAPCPSQPCPQRSNADLNW